MVKPDCTPQVPAITKSFIALRANAAARSPPQHDAADRPRKAGEARLRKSR